eukprot:m.26725 g.26725  ORF g.26725 m.26725 type:complete len:765 (-) comp4324_c0_seq1:134-2428(-)
MKSDGLSLESLTLVDEVLLARKLAAGLKHALSDVLKAPIQLPLSNTCSALKERGGDGAGYPLLCNQLGRETICALVSGGLVGGVPLDQRDAAHAKFLEAYRTWTTDVTCDRMPLLCNAGHRGMGKSVLLALNQYWFAERGGLSVYVSFNDDQCGEGFPFHSNCDSLQQALAARIVHRALVYHLGREAAQAYFKRIRHAIFKSVTSLRAAMVVLHDLVGVPEGTPTMIVVDELAKFDDLRKDKDDGAPNAITIQALKTIMSFCDGRKANHPSPVFPCVSVYGCLDLKTFVSTSNRALHLQLLSPVFPFVDSVDTMLLPDLLRAFVSVPHRALLCEQHPSYENVEDALTSLLLATGGIARRTSSVLVELRGFAAAIPAQPDTSWADSFIKAAAAWLATNKDTILAELKGMDRNVCPITPLALLPEGLTSLHSLDQFARDNTCQYVLSNDSSRDHLQSLVGSVEGYCQLQPVRAASVLTFVPLPVLRATPCFAAGREFAALRELGQSLEHYATANPPPGDVGKPFERVMKSAMLLFARCHDTFTLRELCGRDGGVFDEALQGGLDLLDLTDDSVARNTHSTPFAATLSTEYFPLNPHRSSPQPFTLPYEQRLLQLLQVRRGLCMFPPDNDNMGGSFYLLLPCVKQPGWVLVEFQCKDVFGNFDPAINTVWMAKTVSGWRDGAAYLEGQHASCGGLAANPVPAFLAAHSIRVVRVLCTNNPLQPAVVGALSANEAVLDRVLLRNAVPTAAYNMEGVHRVRSLFAAGAV